MNNEKVLVIAAHPDDEILGCGGTVAKHAKNGDIVNVVIIAEGVTSRYEKINIKKREKELSELSKSSHKANEILGVSSLKLFDFPDNKMDSIIRLDLIKKIEGCIDKFEPSIVYTHHFGDLNVDHRRVHEAVVTSCRPIPGHSVKRILFFEVASSTEWNPSTLFSPNWFVDISGTLDCKLKALEAYKTEIRDFPHSRSFKALKSLAEWRGASVGLFAAEAFILGRNLE
ncbi:PIG-L family deacetylase [Candidatus Babeliales bacterium]|nr:PIG-L family deacetylase [Candidatus Babeliales bacterium]